MTSQCRGIDRRSGTRSKCTASRSSAPFSCSRTGRCRGVRVALASLGREGVLRAIGDAERRADGPEASLVPVDCRLVIDVENLALTLIRCAARRRPRVGGLGVGDGIPRVYRRAAAAGDDEGSTRTSHPRPLAPRPLLARPGQWPGQASCPLRRTLSPICATSLGWCTSLCRLLYVSCCMLYAAVRDTNQPTILLLRLDEPVSRVRCMGHAVDCMFRACSFLYTGR